MGQVTSLFVRKVIRQVDDRVEKGALLRSVGIDPHSPVDPKQMVPAAEYYGFLERIASVDPHTLTLPLRVGASMLCDDYGAFGLAWKSATDLRRSFQRAERYARVLTSVATYEVETDERGTCIRLHRDGERRLGLRLSNEATIASIASISRQVAVRDPSMIEAHFRHPAPESTEAHEAYFGCPAIFGSDRDALYVAEESLSAPNKLGDAGLSQFFDTHLEEQLSQLQDEVSFEQRVRIRIAKSLSEGVPAITEVAKHFAMSGRTLQRRLAERDKTFQMLVDESRRELAKRLLQQTDYSLSEVAFMTGFSEQSAFSRAFKRWAGQTPRSYRLQASPS